MFSFAKLFADIAKLLGASTKFIGYAIALIVVGGSAWSLSRIYYSKNEQLNSVSELSLKIDTLIKRVDKFESNNNTWHTNMNSTISNGFGEVKTIFRMQTEYYDTRFNQLDKNQDSRFFLQRKWLDEKIENSFSQAEKKNETPYRLTQIP